ncbi:MAG: 50S ribosomal protein L17 [Bdellovibrionales bacterium]|nr:50S ribosomal protein L17 [Bdellovibrionales bacterium]
MRHRSQVKRFSRSPEARKALIRGLVSSLVEHERIKTTLPKAKELRRHVERAITMGRKGDLHATRTLLSRYPNKDTVRKIISDLSPRFKERPGGYTRILKLGARAGDGAPMAFIEFVDYNPAKTDDKTTKVKVRDGKRKQTTKEMTTEQKQAYLAAQAEKAAAKKKKHLRQVQSESRRANRA